MSRCHYEHPATLKDIVRAASDGQAVFPITGNCMEAAGIEDGGFVAVDFTRCPRPSRQEGGKHIRGDSCLCYARFQRAVAPTVMCKEYIGYWMGQMVGTRYDRRKGGNDRMDCAFPAEAIFGVVFAVWDRAGQLKWQRDPESYPTELSTLCAVRNGNVVTVSAQQVNRRDGMPLAD